MNRFMTIKGLKEIIKDLEKDGTINDSTVVALSCDSEGNNFGVASSETEFSVSVFAITDQETIIKDAFVLYPIYEGYDCYE